MRLSEFARPGRKAALLLPLLAVVAMNNLGCLRVKTEVEPIDINLTVTLKVERELDSFFDELDTQDETLQPAGPAQAE